MGNDFKAALCLQDNEIVGQSVRQWPVCHQQTTQEEKPKTNTANTTWTSEESCSHIHVLIIF